MRWRIAAAPGRTRCAEVVGPLGLLLLLLLLLGVLPQTAAPAGSVREQLDSIECEACNWAVEQLDEVRNECSVQYPSPPLPAAGCLAAEFRGNPICLLPDALPW